MIGIQCHDQARAFCPRLGQVSHMPAVQDVKDPVGEYHRSTRTKGLHRRWGVGTRDDFAQEHGLKHRKCRW